MDRGVKISSKMLVVIGVILTLVIAVTAWMNASETGQDGTTLSICKNGEEVVSYTLEELMQMPSESVEAKINSTSNADEEGTYTGIMLDDLLEMAGIEDVDTVILTAGDGYSAAADSDEIEDVMVVHTKDGQTLGYYTKGGTGPMRCLFTKDSFGNRSIMYLTRIDCR